MNLTRDEYLAAFHTVFNNMYIRVLITIIVAITLQLLIRTVIAYVVRKAVRGHRYATKADEKKREKTLVGIFRTALAVVVWTITVLVILDQLHVKIAALLTGAGVVGVVIGFGAQNAIKDFLAGFFVITENQYRIGDIITLNVGGAEVSGVVDDITVRITRLRDLDGNLHIIPNGAATMVTNRSFGYANVNVDVGVSYDANIDTVREVINSVGKAIAEDEMWAKHVIEPIAFLRVDSFGDSAVKIKALGKVAPAMQWDIAGEFRRCLLIAFSESGITIPLPQLIVHQAKSETK